MRDIVTRNPDVNQLRKLCPRARPGHAAGGRVRESGEGPDDGRRDSAGDRERDVSRRAASVSHACRKPSAGRRPALRKTMKHEHPQRHPPQRGHRPRRPTSTSTSAPRRCSASTRSCSRATSRSSRPRAPMRLAKEMMSEKRWADFEEQRDSDFSYEIPGARPLPRQRPLPAEQRRALHPNDQRQGPPDRAAVPARHRATS